MAINTERNIRKGLSHYIKRIGVNDLELKQILYTIYYFTKHGYNAEVKYCNPSTIVFNFRNPMILTMAISTLKNHGFQWNIECNFRTNKLTLKRQYFIPMFDIESAPSPFSTSDMYIVREYFKWRKEMFEV